MPIVTLTLRKPKSPAFKSTVLDAVQAALVAAGANPDDRFQSAEEMRLGLEDWLAKSNKIVTHTDISKAVNERLNPAVKEQIHALRNANRFVAQTINNRIMDDDPGSWELPTAVSGLIQVPEDLAPSVMTASRVRPSFTSAIARRFVHPACSGSTASPASAVRSASSNRRWSNRIADSRNR